MCFTIHMEESCKKQHSWPGIALCADKEVLDRVDGLCNYLKGKLGQIWGVGNPLSGKSYLGTSGDIENQGLY